MASPNLLIDTSIIIEHLRKQNRERSILYGIVDQYELAVSTMVEFELFIGATSEPKQQDVDKILAWCTTLPLTTIVAQTAATIYNDLKRTNQLIEIRDILIGATAVVHEMQLMTLNSKHFERIKSVQIISAPTT